ncbi:taurine catabolism dioxygenase TauD, TfdA family-domain-containing protein, partial [Lineolata rhizophorae]
LDPAWLRDACRCPRCVDPYSGQKTFDTGDIPAGLRCRRAQGAGGAGTVTLEWENDVPGFGEDHRTELPIVELRTALRENGDPRGGIPRRADRPAHWDKDELLKSDLWHSYEGYMSDDGALLKLLAQLQRYGIVFLKDVPPSADAVSDIATRIGPLKETFYGRTWDVKSIPKAENVAYTSQYLGFHMDLLYFIQPPFLQLLHTLKAEATGGASIFADSFRAVNSIRRSKHALWLALNTVPVKHHYDHENHKYEHSRPTVELDGRARDIAYVNYSPPFQAPFVRAKPGWNLASYHAAIAEFKRIIELEHNRFEYRMQEGDCVIFNNRRVLHGRAAFKEDGERWLRGAYVDEDDFISKRKVLMAK